MRSWPSLFIQESTINRIDITESDHHRSQRRRRERSERRRNMHRNARRIRRARDWLQALHEAPPPARDLFQALHEAPLPARDLFKAQHKARPPAPPAQALPSSPPSTPQSSLPEPETEPKPCGTLIVSYILIHLLQTDPIMVFEMHINSALKQLSVHILSSAKIIHLAAQYIYQAAQSTSI